MPLPVLLTSADDDLIRAAIRADLSPSDLPNTVVELSFGPATREVVAIDPAAGTYTAGSDQATNSHAAAVLFAAAWLMPMVPLVDRESFQGYSYAFADQMSVADRISMLRAQAQEVLLANLDETLVALMPTMMTLAPGGRGDISEWPPGIVPGMVPLTQPGL